MEYNNKKVESLANMLMIDVSQEEVEAIVEDTSFNDYLIFMQNIDTQDVAMMHLPYDEVTTYLRDDSIEYVLERETMFKNAPKHDNQFIEVVQVISK
ncbi:aspartyl/glutamyl-tRNA amidotransferase subunit C [Erysipelothrix urinaevulpis]|uniref:Asp-tRNA(Asn)/Glu-tRNA(Gln) amidotransferase subunit GatC n=1 Tax=Erysipelothrix urinaevulpis TaxID=2683717 RepID=UPI001357DB1E|nr:hypothetical protein [Erysipelothrix urinaevulpis]